MLSHRLKAGRSHCGLVSCFLTTGVHRMVRKAVCFAIEDALCLRIVVVIITSCHVCGGRAHRGSEVGWSRCGTRIGFPRRTSIDHLWTLMSLCIQILYRYRLLTHIRHEVSRREVYATIAGSIAHASRNIACARCSSSKPSSSSQLCFAKASPTPPSPMPLSAH